MNENKSESTQFYSTKESVTFFKTQDDFRKWLESHHEKETELIVGFYKVDSGKPSMSWSQSVDQALCFGWIDGVRKSIDKESYSIRFTPRRRTSNWSAINIKKVEELAKAGLMKPAGLKSFSLRKENKSEIYSYEKDTLFLDSNYEIQFKENKKAWDFFMKQAPSYKKAIMRWIMSAMQEKTRLSRLEKTIKESEQQKRVS
ncbi:MAG: YdeI/OmpD-associated family protein [Bacteroidales bacterium]|nr:YdeI/OmpD-associated family protein [Bacteroidales bacterium]